MDGLLRLPGKAHDKINRLIIEVRSSATTASSLSSGRPVRGTISVFTYRSTSSPRALSHRHRAVQKRNAQPFPAYASMLDCHLMIFPLDRGSDNVNVGACAHCCHSLSQSRAYTYYINPSQPAGPSA
jgi:hypothetical protein